MVKDEQIKSFVRCSLGCECPEEVFEHIEYKDNVELEGEITLDSRINVGNRLLIFILETDDADFITDNLSKIIEAGKNERDQLAFNRFRMVIVTDNTAELKIAAESLFNSFDGLDERIHLHIINKDNNLK